MSKELSTKTTIRNLTAEIKKSFVKKDAFGPVQTAAEKAIKSLDVTGNTISFFTSTDKTGTAAFTVDFPTEMFLDQTKTEFVPSFAFSETTYPGATDPKLEGKPIMVLAVKGENPDSCTYSFLSMLRWWIPTRLRPSARMLPPPSPSLAMRLMSRSMFPLLLATF